LTTDSNGRVTITPTVPIPEGNVRAKATDNAEHPNRFGSVVTVIGVLVVALPVKSFVTTGSVGGVVSVA
jgi:hypothetical protein